MKHCCACTHPRAHAYTLKCTHAHTHAQHKHTHTHTHQTPSFFLLNAKASPISNSSSKFQMSHFPKSLLSVQLLSANFLCVENKIKIK